MVFELYITRTADKQLAKLPVGVRCHIRAALEKLAGDPFAAGHDVKKLKGRSYYRLRVGKYRVIYDLQNDRLMILVLDIFHRQKGY